MSKSLRATAPAFVPKSSLKATAKPFFLPVHNRNKVKRRTKQQRRRKVEEEQKRKQQEEKKRKEEEARRLAELEKKAEEERKRKEEEERIRKEEEERRRKEEEEKLRKEEEERIAKEEERRRQEKAEEERRLKAEEDERCKEREKQNRIIASRKYPRKFLLSFQTRFTTRPQGLPTAAQFLKGGKNSNTKWQRGGRDGHSGRGNSHNNRGRRDNYRNRNQQHRRNKKHNNRDRRRGGNGRNQPDAPMDIEIKALEKTEQGYVVQKNVEPDQKLMRSVNSILNKLTPEKFEVLTKRFLDLEIDTYHRLRDVVSAIFEKSLAEANFCPTYAAFCQALNAKLPTFDYTDQKGKRSTQTFKRLLLNQCQKEFEKEGAIDQKEVDKLETQEEKDLYLLKAKQRRFGTIRLIGELYLRHLIVRKIVYFCFKVLLSDPDHPDEANLESLCKLFTTIGKIITKSERNLPPKQRIAGQTLRKMKYLLDKKLIKQSRIRFAVQDTLDMSSNGWVPRMKQVTAKKISEIHAAAADDKERAREKERRRIKQNKRRDFDYRHFERAAPAPVRKYHDNRRRAGRHNRDADGWESTSNRKPNTRRSQDVRNMRQPMRQQTSPKQNSRNRRRNNKQPKSPVRLRPQRSAFADLLIDEDDHDSEEEVTQQAPEPVSPTPAPKATEEKKLSEQDVTRITKDIKAFIQEYFGAVDLNEAKLCAQELGTTQLHHNIVFEGILSSFEKRAREQELLGKLFDYFVEEKVLSASHIETGFNKLMEWGNDMFLDYPLMFKILGSHLATFILHKRRTISLDYLCSDPTAQLSSENRKRFAFGTLTAIKAAKDEAGLNKVVKATKGFSLSKLGIETSELADQGLACLS